MKLPDENLSACQTMMYRCSFSLATSVQSSLSSLQDRLDVFASLRRPWCPSTSGRAGWGAGSYVALTQQFLQKCFGFPLISPRRLCDPWPGFSPIYFYTEVMFGESRPSN